MSSFVSASSLKACPFQGPDEAEFKLKTSRNAVFLGGAIPHSFSSESPAEKMHAHLRSFSFYRKIVTQKISNLCAIFYIK